MRILPILLVASTLVVGCGNDNPSGLDQAIQELCAQHEQLGLNPATGEPAPGCGVGASHIAADGCYDRVARVADCEDCKVALFKAHECQWEKQTCEDPECGRADPWIAWFNCDCVDD
ncbi:MAG: hypothetical protein AAF500_17675 [Myxococcota bacterium]